MGAALALVSYSPIFELTYPCAILLACGQISSPTQTGVAVRCVSESEQGTFQAANGSLDVVAKIVSAAMVAAIFKPLVDAGQAGVIWWIGCAVLLLGTRVAFKLGDYLPSTFHEVKNAAGGEQMPETLGKQDVDPANQ